MAKINIQTTREVTIEVSAEQLRKLVLEEFRQHLVDFDLIEADIAEICLNNDWVNRDLRGEETVLTIELHQQSNETPK